MSEELPPISVEDILAVIESLTDAERLKLWKALERRTDLTGNYVVAPKAVLDLCVKTAKAAITQLCETLPLLTEAGNRAYRMTPKPRNTERDAAIIRLRKQNPKKWSRKLLAKHFKVKESTIRQVIYLAKKRGDL